jgi:hypothetical protein
VLGLGLAVLGTWFFSAGNLVSARNQRHGPDHRPGHEAGRGAAAVKQVGVGDVEDRRGREHHLFRDAVAGAALGGDTVLGLGLAVLGTWFFSAGNHRETEAQHRVAAERRARDRVAEQQQDSGEPDHRPATGSPSGP